MPWDNIKIPPNTENADHSQVQFTLDGGLHFEKSPRLLGGDESVSMQDVRYKGTALTKDFGYTVQGTPCAQTLYGLGDYTYGVIRVPWRSYWTGLSVAGVLNLEYWDGSSWTATTPATTTQIGVAPAEIVSFVSMYGWLLLTAGGTGHIQKFDLAFATAVVDLDASAPAARFIAPFGTRIIAFRVDGDPQKVAWPVSGLLNDWTGVGSSSSILADVRSDVVDALMGGCQLGSDTFAVFRQRSIWRAFLTGQSSQAIGFKPWKDGIGTECPFSIKNVGRGALFLANDYMVYLLDPSGNLTPVGFPIQKELERIATLSENTVVAGYDYNRQEYWLGLVDQAVIFILDLKRLANENKLVWRQKGAAFTLIADPSAQNTGVVYHDATTTNDFPEIWFADGVNTRITTNNGFTKSGLSYTGYKVFGPLNKRPVIATLTMLTLYYNSPSLSSITVKVSGDGGQIWAESKSLTIAATTGKDATVSIGFNTTGTDLRFKLEFDQTVAYNITGYDPVVVERGGVEYG